MQVQVAEAFTEFYNGFGSLRIPQSMPILNIINDLAR